MVENLLLIIRVIIKVSRANLLPNVRIRRRYRQRTTPLISGRRKRGQGFGKIIYFAWKVARKSIVKSLGKMKLKHAPFKIKNKKSKGILQSNIANSLVDMDAAYRQGKLS